MKTILIQLLISNSQKAQSVYKYWAVLISPYPDPEGNKLQRPNLGFIQYTPHEAQYNSYPAALT